MVSEEEFARIYLHRQAVRKMKKAKQTQRDYNGFRIKSYIMRLKARGLDD